MTKLSFRRLFAVSFSIAIIVSPLAAQGTMGYLKVKAHPKRAGVFIDNKYLGPAANFGVTRKYPVAPGKHEIELKESLSEDYATAVEIVSGKTTTIQETMKPIE